MTQYQNVIAIDGPSGSGKSTLARRLAQELNVVYIDTGAMFRALAYYADLKQIAFEEGQQMREFLSSLSMIYGQSEEVLISINGMDLTQKIREHQVSKLASIISKLPCVRAFLLDFQRQLAQNTLCVMEGRDIGTVVFPQAFCKFFITASTQVRSQRRLEQLIQQGEGQVNLEQVIKDVEKRDQSDREREVAPLKQAQDAVYLDTSGLSLDDVLLFLINEVKTRAQNSGINLAKGL